MLGIIISLVIGFISGIAFTILKIALRVTSSKEIQDDFQSLIEKIKEGV